MLKDILISLVQFILLFFFQVLVLDNISLWGMVNPMVYVWFIILLPYNTPRWLTLTSSFLLGICVDIFSSQMGINAFACTLVAFIRPLLLNAFSGNIENTFQRPSASRLGFVNFLFYVIILVAIHHLTYFLLGTFALNEIISVLFRTLISLAATVIIIILCDAVFFHKQE
ncbi:MAG: rod shape-determining protein MreD [Bacteroidales bacterium]|nr:rod shape-determining protein MreD [Bacteroidales bacterium]